MSRIPLHAALVVGAMLALTIAAASSASWMMQQRADARYARQQLADCRLVASGIESLRNAPKFAASKAVDRQRIAERIQQAFQEAGVRSRQSAELIDPVNPRRVGGTPYLRQPTRVSLGELTLRETAMFLYHLTADSRLNATGLRLRSAAGLNTTQWNAETTVTYLIYAPRTDSAP
jgi:hypothetical protein